RVVSYATTEGGVNLEKTRLEWHPENLKNFISSPFKKEDADQKKAGSPAKPKLIKKKTPPPTHRLTLKNRSVLQGRVIRQDDAGILLGLEEGEIFFNRNEVASLEEL
ncbi:MAG: hypothetical protein ABH845_02310, partial [Candidatus Omnitrophota bacterium]